MNVNSRPSCIQTFRKYHRLKARIVQNLISLPSKIFSLWPNVIYIDNLFGAPRRVTHLKMQLFCRIVPSPPAPSGLHHHADCLTEKLWGVFQWITVWMSASQLVSDVVPVRGCETLWPPPHLLPLKNSRCDPASSLFCEQKPIKESWKKFMSNINYDISWEINSPSVNYG